MRSLSFFLFVPFADEPFFVGEALVFFLVGPFAGERSALRAPLFLFAMAPFVRASRWQSCWRSDDVVMLDGDKSGESLTLMATATCGEGGRDSARSDVWR